MLNKIINLYKENRLTEVINIVSVNETDIKLLELKGISAIKLNKFKIALDCFKKIIEKDISPINCYHYAIANMQLNNYDEAIIYFRESEKDPKFKNNAQINKAHCLLKHYRSKNNLQKLKKILKQSNNYCGDTIEWHKSNIFLQYRELNYENLITNYKNSKHIKDIYIKGLIAKSYTKLSKFNQAITLYKEIKQQSPTALNVYNLAAAYSNLTSTTQLNIAIEYAQLCIKQDASFHQAYFCIALVHQKLQNYKHALDYCKKAQKLDKTNENYTLTRAELLNSKGNSKKCLKQLTKILKLNKNNRKALRLKGICKLKQNKIKSSKRLLKKAIRLDKTDQRAIAYYAITQLAQGKSKQVKEFLSLGYLVKEFKLDNTETYQTIHDFNRDFEKDIKQHSLLRKNPKGLAARNGYLTDDLFADKSTSILVFKKHLNDKIKDYIGNLPVDSNHHMLRHKTQNYTLNAWATWVQGDGFIDKHIHEDSWISGVYYCKVPAIIDKTDDYKGYLEYGCVPNDIKINIKKEKGYIKPIEGKLVIFPSYLYHQTIPHITADDRISVAFDLTPKSWRK